MKQQGLFPCGLLLYFSSLSSGTFSQSDALSKKYKRKRKGKKIKAISTLQAIYNEAPFKTTTLCHFYNALPLKSITRSSTGTQTSVVITHGWGSRWVSGDCKSHTDYELQMWPRMDSYSLGNTDKKSTSFNTEGFFFFFCQGNCRSLLITMTWPPVFSRWSQQQQPSCCLLWQTCSFSEVGWGFFF